MPRQRSAPPATRELLVPGDVVRLLNCASNIGRFPKRVGTTGLLLSVPSPDHPKGENARQWEVRFADEKIMKFKRTTITLHTPSPSRQAGAGQQGATPADASGNATAAAAAAAAPGHNAGAQLPQKRKASPVSAAAAGAGAGAGAATGADAGAPAEKRAAIAGGGAGGAGGDNSAVGGAGGNSDGGVAAQVRAAVGRTVAEIAPDLWESLAVRIVTGKGRECVAAVLSTGNGWIQVQVLRGPGAARWQAVGSLAKRSHELLVYGLKADLLAEEGGAAAAAAAAGTAAASSSHSTRRDTRGRAADADAHAVGRRGAAGRRPPRDRTAASAEAARKAAPSARAAAGAGGTAPGTSSATTLNTSPGASSTSSSAMATPRRASTMPAGAGAVRGGGKGGAEDVGFAAGADQIMHCHRHLSSPGMSTSASRKAEDEARQARTRFYIDKQRATFFPNRPNFSRWLEQVAFDNATQELLKMRTGPRDLVSQKYCPCCKLSIEPDDEFCWNLGCTACPAYEDPWEHHAAQMRATAAGNHSTAHAISQGPSHDHVYRKYAPVQWIGGRFRCGRPVREVTGPVGPTAATTTTTTAAASSSGGGGGSVLDSHGRAQYAKPPPVAAVAGSVGWTATEVDRTYVVLENERADQDDDSGGSDSDGGSRGRSSSGPFRRGGSGNGGGGSSHATPAVRQGPVVLYNPHHLRGVKRSVEVRRVPKATGPEVGSGLQYRWSAWNRDENPGDHPVLDGSSALMRMRTDALAPEKYAALRTKLFDRAGKAPPLPSAAGSAAAATAAAAAASAAGGGGATKKKAAKSRRKARPGPHGKK